MPNRSFNNLNGEQNAKNEDQERRQKALQVPGERQDQAYPFASAPYPYHEDHQAKAQIARHGDHFSI
jgi:hypothetical protein